MEGHIKGKCTNRKVCLDLAGCLGFGMRADTQRGLMWVVGGLQ